MSDELINLMEKFAAELGEHCNAVQILCSHSVDGGGTRGVKRGSGDWYSRQGLAHEFINSDQADDLSDQIARKINPPDDTENWKNADV